MIKKFILFSVIAVVVSLVINVFAGGWIAARVASIPTLQKYHLFNPQAPIVITQKQEVRVSDSGDILDAVNQAKSRLSAIVTLGPGSLIDNGAAINLSNDGYFLTVAAALSKNPATQTVILSGGQHGVIQKVFTDPATSLVIVKVDVSGAAVADFAASKSFVSGQRVMFVHDSSTADGVRFQATFVQQTQNDTSGQLAASDYPTRSYMVQQTGTLLPGETVIDLNGKIAGIWDGQKLISSDVMSDMVRNFFGNSQSIVRPTWGFTYRNINTVEGDLFQLPKGAQVLTVDAGSPAAKAGLEAGDTITAVGGQQIGSDTSLEELLQRSGKAGQLLAFTVVRNKNVITVSITPGQLEK